MQLRKIKGEKQWFYLAFNGQTMNNSILFIPTQTKSKHHHLDVGKREIISPVSPLTS